MKLYLPLFKYTYNVTPQGISPGQSKFTDADDKELYISIMKSLNVDFLNAPIDITRMHPLQQKIVYVMENNTHYDMEVDQFIDIRTGKEAIPMSEYYKMIPKIPNSKFLNGETDLQ
jgi:hypothetical protein